MAMEVAPATPMENRTLARFGGFFAMLERMHSK